MEQEDKTSKFRVAKAMHSALCGETFEERVDRRVKAIVAEIEARIPEIPAGTLENEIKSAKIFVESTIITHRIKTPPRFTDEEISEYYDVDLDLVKEIRNNLKPS